MKWCGQTYKGGVVVRAPRHMKRGALVGGEVLHYRRSAPEEKARKEGGGARGRRVGGEKIKNEVDRGPEEIECSAARARARIIAPLLRPARLRGGRASPNNQKCAENN